MVNSPPATLSPKLDVRRWWGPVVLFASLLIVYSVTLAPGLTWAHDGADGGDLIAAAVSGGVAHPTGYPVYLLLARLFLKLPISSPAWRVNYLSTVSAACAAVVVAILIQRVYWGRPWAGRIAGWLAGFAFGLSPLLWSQAVIAEVYSLHACLVALCWLAMPLGQGPQITWRTALLLGLAVGVALGNHATAIFLLPPAIAALWVKAGRWRHLAVAGLVFAIVIGTLYGIVLPIWASYQPAINWGSATTIQGWWWLVSAQAYRGLAFGASQYIVERLLQVLGLWVVQFGAWGIVVGLSAVFLLDEQPPVLRFGLVWLFLICTFFAVGYNTADSYNYLVPAFLAFVIELGLGLAVGLESLARRHQGWVPLGLAAWIILLFSAAPMAMASSDASQDVRAEAFVRALTQLVPPRAIVITGQDRDTFAAWYWHEALNQGSDTVLIAERLWSFDWYHQELSARYPDLYLPLAADADWQQKLLQQNSRTICRTILDQPQALTCQRPGN